MNWLGGSTWLRYSGDDAHALRSVHHNSDAQANQNRRRFLLGIGAATAAVAGCSSDDDPAADADESPVETDAAAIRVEAASGGTTEIRPQDRSVSVGATLETAVELDGED